MTFGCEYPPKIASKLTVPPISTEQSSGPRIIYAGISGCSLGFVSNVTVGDAVGKTTKSVKTVVSVESGCVGI